MPTLEAVVISDYKTPLIEKDQTMSVNKLSSQEIRRMPGRSLNGEVEYLSGVTSGYNDFWNRSQTDRQRNYSVHEDKEEGIVISNYISNSLKDNISNMEYVIDIPYTIPASGEDYLIRIKEVSLPVQYLYHAVPKVESGVFLSAEIADWTQLKLLAWDMNIYYQGTYTGHSFIDVEKASDTLSISLGRDHNILVMREGNKELFDKKQFGSNVKETIGWDITVRNNQAASVT